MTRNETIRARRRAGESHQAIADSYGLTRERIRQICVGIPRPMKARRCSYPGCTRLMVGPRQRRRCRLHPVRQKWARLTCATCGIMFDRHAANVRPDAPNPLRKRPQRLFFCGRSCFGRWLGKHHGRQASPRTLRIRALAVGEPLVETVSETTVQRAASTAHSAATSVGQRVTTRHDRAASTLTVTRVS